MITFTQLRSVLPAYSARIVGEKIATTIIEYDNSTDTKRESIMDNSSNVMSSGFHMFEIHLPSSMSTAIVVACVLILTMLLYKCARWTGFKKHERRHNRHQHLLRCHRRQVTNEINQQHARSLCASSTSLVKAERPTPSINSVIFVDETSQ